MRKTMIFWIVITAFGSILAQANPLEIQSSSCAIAGRDTILTITDKSGTRYTLTYGLFKQKRIVRQIEISHTNSEEPRGLARTSIPGVGLFDVMVADFDLSAITGDPISA